MYAVRLVVIKGTLCGFIFYLVVVGGGGGGVGGGGGGYPRRETNPGRQDGMENPVSNQLDHPDCWSLSQKCLNCLSQDFI